MTRHLEDDSSVALDVEKRLLDEILELTKKRDFTNADQERLEALSTRRDKLHATEAWLRVLADKANQQGVKESSFWH